MKLRVNDMSKNRKRSSVKKSLNKAEPLDKVSRVMSEYKDGKLKGRDGKIITDRRQAVAIALSEAGLSKKSLEKAELLTKVKVYKAALEKMIEKEISKNKVLKDRLHRLFKEKKVSEKDIQEFAQKNGLMPTEVLNIVYDLFSGYKTSEDEGPIG